MYLHPHTRAALTAALTNTEATLQRHGWDLPPVLVGLFDRRLSIVDCRIEVDDTAVVPGTWHRPDPANPGENLHPVTVLIQLGTELAHPRLRPWLRDWLHREGRMFLGFGFCFEGWQAPIRPGYRHGDLAHGPADQRTEVRAVAALDIDGHDYQITRRRGEPHPRVTVSDTPASQTSDSRILTGLRTLNHLGHTR